MLKSTEVKGNHLQQFKRLSPAVNVGVLLYLTGHKHTNCAIHLFCTTPSRQKTQSNGENSDLFHCYCKKTTNQPKKKKHNSAAFQLLCQ